MPIWSALSGLGSTLLGGISGGISKGLETGIGQRIAGSIAGSHSGLQLQGQTLQSSLDAQNFSQQAHAPVSNAQYAQMALTRRIEKERNETAIKIAGMRAWAERERLRVQLEAARNQRAAPTRLFDWLTGTGREHILNPDYNRSRRNSQ